VVCAGCDHLDCAPRGPFHVAHGCCGSSPPYGSTHLRLVHGVSSARSPLFRHPCPCTVSTRGQVPWCRMYYIFDVPPESWSTIWAHSTGV
jgi:hypothetical protein